MTTSEQVRTLLRYTQFAIDKNMHEITDAQALVAPAPAGNSINWVLGHIVFHRNPMHALVELPPVWSDAEKERYVRGSANIVEGGPGVHSVEKMLADLAASTRRLSEALPTMSEARLDEAAPNGKSSRGEQLVGLCFHETYHAGQIGILRRLAGHPPALQ